MRLIFLRRDTKDKQFKDKLSWILLAVTSHILGHPIGTCSTECVDAI